MNNSFFWDLGYWPVYFFATILAVSLAPVAKTDATMPIINAELGFLAYLKQSAYDGTMTDMEPAKAATCGTNRCNGVSSAMLFCLTLGIYGPVLPIECTKM